MNLIYLIKGNFFIKTFWLVALKWKEIVFSYLKEATQLFSTYFVTKISNIFTDKYSEINNEEHHAKPMQKPCMHKIPIFQYFA